MIANAKRTVGHVSVMLPGICTRIRLHCLVTDLNSRSDRPAGDEQLGSRPIEPICADGKVAAGGEPSVCAAIKHSWHEPHKAFSPIDHLCARVVLAIRLNYAEHSMGSGSGRGYVAAAGTCTFK